MNIIEKEIILKIINDLHKFDWMLHSYYDGEELVRVSKSSILMDELNQLEMSTIYFMKHPDGQMLQGVTLIFNNGNHGIDLITDYHCKYSDFGNTIDNVCSWADEMDWCEFLMEKLSKYDNRYN
jgi:hypothetical protein